MVGPREGALKALVNAAKFDAVREAADTQAELLATALPRLESAVVVPIPTIRPHVRRRGYDHALRIARGVAKRIGGDCRQLVQRQSVSVQHGASRQVRLAQARTAFAVRGHITADANYILVDDVTTTGASLVEAAKTLRKAGARRVYVAVTTYQLPQ